MTKIVTRPKFFEGQILSADNLSALTQYPRARDERHNRFVHRWGIVAGLELEAEDSEDASGNAFKRVFLGPGLAIDGHGLEILVPERVELDSARFLQTVGASVDETAAYPVFLISQFQPPLPGAAGLGLCQANGETSVEEGFDILFGRLGDEILDQAPPDLSADPAEEVGSSGWKILVGYVKWTIAANEFSDISLGADTTSRRYIGINAETMAGYDGQLQLQTQQALSAGVPVLKMSEEDGGQLCFGLFEGTGTSIDKLFTVTRDGDVIAKGAISGRLTTGAVQMQSGIASDGIILPLPPGISTKQVTDGLATVHVDISPIIDPAHSPDPTQEMAALIQECRVDDDRRLHCRICWFSLEFNPAAPPPHHGAMLASVPGSCRYVVSATVPAEGAA